MKGSRPAALLRIAVRLTLELPGDFTVEAWVRPSSVTGVQNVVTKWAAAQDGKYTYRLYLDEGVPGIELSTQGLQVYTIESAEAIPVAVEEWTHLAAVRKGDAVRLLVDEAEVATGTVAGALYDGEAAMVVGASGVVGEANPFMGRIDEVRVSRADRSTDGPGGTSTLGRVTVDYLYNARNQLVTETSVTSVKTYSYDMNGNTLAIVETVSGAEIAREDMTYDELNRMTSHTGPKGTESFTYRGAEWHRFSKSANGVGKGFLYDGDNVIQDIGGLGGSTFYVTPFLDQNLSMTRSGATHYYAQDGLGSARTLTDSRGSVANRYDYLPFGGAHQPGTSVSVPQRYTYTGREQNPTSNLMYYRYRQYDPKVGRFRARDPLDPWVMLVSNLFGYSAMSPVNFRDPHGLAEFTFTAWETLKEKIEGQSKVGKLSCGKWALMKSTWQEQFRCEDPDDPRLTWASSVKPTSQSLTTSDTIYDCPQTPELLKKLQEEIDLPSIKLPMPGKGGEAGVTPKLKVGARMGKVCSKAMYVTHKRVDKACITYTMKWRVSRTQPFTLGVWAGVQSSTSVGGVKVGDYSKMIAVPGVSASGGTWKDAVLQRTYKICCCCPAEGQLSWEATPESGTLSNVPGGVSFTGEYDPGPGCKSEGE